MLDKNNKNQVRIKYSMWSNLEYLPTEQFMCILKHIREVDGKEDRPRPFS